MLFIFKISSRLKYKICYRYSRESILKEFPVCSTTVHDQKALMNGTQDLMDAQTSLLKLSNSAQQNHCPRFENFTHTWKTLSYVERNANAKNTRSERHINKSQAIAILHNAASLFVKNRKVLPTQIRSIHQLCSDFPSSSASKDIESPSAEARSCKAPLKSLKDIPGPFNLPWVGTSWMYWPLGQYNRHTFHQADEDLYARFGPIYREQRGGVTLVSIHRADDIERVFRQEGPRPLRVVNEALVHRRRQQPHVYPTVGLAEA